MQNLANLRRRARMTQEELAAAAEQALPELPPKRILRAYIGDMETGRNEDPSALIVLRIAAVLECDPKELFILSSEGQPS